MDLTRFYATPARRFLTTLAGGLIVASAFTPTSLAAAMPNACPVDGCTARIVSVQMMGDELEVTLEANYTPDNARNHLHMWWGEQYSAQQVGRNAQSEHNVTQGKWHRHDDYPVYMTTGAVSVTVRDGATTLCVTAADRDHNVIDADVFHCMDVGAALN
ncbi:MAG: hypothetical protein KTR33_13520 [Gammaproteobacteria bacterium]|nr:hypothetical protein [Gammaproteobacteria bacterium]